MNQEEKKQFMWKVNSDTGRALADLRQHRGMTLEQVGAASDYEPENIAAAEAGKLPHNVHNLARTIMKQSQVWGTGDEFTMRQGGEDQLLPGCNITSLDSAVPWLGSLPQMRVPWGNCWGARLNETQPM